MRFHINTMSRGGTVEKVEVLGEECSFPNTGDERFAVHHNIFPRDHDGPEFAVSHVETGFLVVLGETIDEAIELARMKLADKGEEKLRASIGKAKNMLEATNLGSTH